MPPRRSSSARNHQINLQKVVQQKCISQSTCPIDKQGCHHQQAAVEEQEQQRQALEPQQPVLQEQVVAVKVESDQEPTCC